MPMPEALAWFRDHPPAGIRASGIGRGSGQAGTTFESLMYEDKPTAAYNSATLIIEIAPVGAGSSGVRADGQTTWVPPKTAQDVIPGEISRVSLVAYENTPRTVLAHRSLTGGEAERLRLLVNDLPPDNRGAHGCVPDSGLRIRMTFHTTGGPFVFTESPGCFEVHSASSGQGQPGLLDSFALRRVLFTDLGLEEADFIPV